MVRYRPDTGEMQAGNPKNTIQGRGEGSYYYLLLYLYIYIYS